MQDIFTKTYLNIICEQGSKFKDAAHDIVQELDYIEDIQRKKVAQKQHKKLKDINLKSDDLLYNAIGNHFNDALNKITNIASILSTTTEQEKENNTIIESKMFLIYLKARIEKNFEQNNFNKIPSSVIQKFDNLNLTALISDSKGISREQVLYNFYKNNEKIVNDNSQEFYKMISKPRSPSLIYYDYNNNPLTELQTAMFNYNPNLGNDIMSVGKGEYYLCFKYGLKFSDAGGVDLQTANEGKRKRYFEVKNMSTSNPTLHCTFDENDMVNGEGMSEEVFKAANYIIFIEGGMEQWSAEKVGTAISGIFKKPGPNDNGFFTVNGQKTIFKYEPVRSNGGIKLTNIVLNNFKTYIEQPIINDQNGTRYNQIIFIKPQRKKREKKIKNNENPQD